jgi:6-phosphogluconate dehydrogenase
MTLSAPSGSTIGSQMLDRLADALPESPQSSKFQECVSDSGEGRWIITAAIDEDVSVDRRKEIGGGGR